MQFKNPSLFEEEKSNKNIYSPITSNKNIYTYNFDIKYDVVKPVIKDFQMMSQLIKFIKNYQMDDLIFITGNSTCSKDSIFYFNYRKIIDFYSLVLDFQESENFLKIVYYVYKTKPICKKFKLIFSLFEFEKKAKLEIEIIPNNNVIIPEKYLNIIYSEFDYNFLYLSLALKLKKEKLIHFNSGIINNEFSIISQIIQNIKIIEYLINRKLINITNGNTDEEKIILDKKDNYIHLNEIYKLILRKQKGDIPEKDIILKVINFKSRDDILDIKLKILSNSKNKENDDTNNNSLYNIITINLRKITKNSSFILIKCIFDPEQSDDNGILIKKFLNKFLSRIQKLSELNL